MDSEEGFVSLQSRSEDRLVILATTSFKLVNIEIPVVDNEVLCLSKEDNSKLVKNIFFLTAELTDAIEVLAIEETQEQSKVMGMSKIVEKYLTKNETIKNYMTAMMQEDIEDNLAEYAASKESK